MTFNDYYNQLNPEQKQAVDSIEGPVMVVAGPGTGKTQILTLRIANILNKTDIEAENILALTFTDSGAMSMKKRLISIIGNDAYRVNINTFHSFCNDVIQNYPEYFSSIAGFTNIDEIKQTQILRNVLDNMKLTYLASFNNQYFYIKEIKHAIEELKKESVDFKELRTKAEQAKFDFLNNTDNYNSKTDKIKTAQLSILKTIEKNIELSFIYEDYQQELKQNLFYDYSDMIIEVLNALKTNEELLLILQEQYQYILVDEYQDTNTSQNKILELLCNFHQNPNIFIVGDPKQAIYRFQGASIQNFEFFKQLYPKAILIDLINNYRSSQLILDSAHSLIQKDVKLQSNAGFEDKKIQVFSLANPEKEAYFIITKIQELLKDGIPSNNIAVLYRNHRDADATIELLDKFGIPFSVKKKINIFNDVDIQKLLLILNTIYNYGNDEYLFKCLHIDFLNIDPLDVYKIINYCNQNHINGYEFLNSKHNLELTSIKQIESFNLKLKQWSIASTNELFINLFEKIIKDVSFYEYIQTCNNIVDKIDKIDGLFDQIKKLAQIDKTFFLSDFIKYLDIVEASGIDVNRDSLLGDLSGIKLMTAHSAKGLEFEYVFIIGATSNNWEGKRTVNKLKLIPEVYNLKDEDVDASEERNLFFVCLTRAKKQLFVTFYETQADGKSVVESAFINEIKDEYKEFEKLNLEEAFKNEKIHFMTSKTKEASIKDKELIKELFTQHGLSVTAFNNYLECPWKYFYRNLFRLPEVMNKSLIKGNAIHSALKDFFNSYKTEGRPTKEFLQLRFEFYLNTYPLSLNDYDQLLSEGEEILSSYYDFYPEFHENVLTEFSISGINLDDNICLTGKLDKVEIFNNNHVAVIDYKTGKPKSENEIMGKTQSGDENYYNQLKFYGLLLKYYQNGKYIMDKGVIDFIEPNESGKHIKREFIISEDEIKELEIKVKEVGNEILNLSFWDKYCDDPKCEFCQLRKMMN